MLAPIAEPPEARVFTSIGRAFMARLWAWMKDLTLADQLRIARIIIRFIDLFT